LTPIAGVTLPLTCPPFDQFFERRPEVADPAIISG
jgi:hypothetical protein